MKVLFINTDDGICCQNLDKVHRQNDLGNYKEFYAGRRQKIAFEKQAQVQREF